MINIDNSRFRFLGEALYNVMFYFEVSVVSILNFSSSFPQMLVNMTAPTLCSAPHIPRYSSIESPHLNYNYDDTVTVTCDTNSDQFTLRCQASGLWNGPDISCAAPILPKIPASCKQIYFRYYIGNVFFIILLSTQRELFPPSSSSLSSCSFSLSSPLPLP